MPTLPDYPVTAGFKARDTETSEAAAMAVEPAAKRLRRQVEEAYAGSRLGMTHDECAELLWLGGPKDSADWERFKRSVRSRASELKAAGLLDPLPDRRKNESGHPAVVFRHRKFAPPPPPEKRVQQDLL